MLYIPCVEFQFCIHYIQLPFEKKWLPEISKGGQDSGKGGANETLIPTVHDHLVEPRLPQANNAVLLFVPFPTSSSSPPNDYHLPNSYTLH